MKVTSSRDYPTIVLFRPMIARLSPKVVTLSIREVFTKVGRVMLNNSSVISRSGRPEDQFPRDAVCIS
jgi:hypothetical protein